MSQGPTISKVKEYDDAALAEALDKGMDILNGDLSTLLIDLDTKDHCGMFYDSFEYVMTYYNGFESIQGWRSKSNNVHIQIKLNQEIGYHEIMGSQLILGSDPERERWSQVKYMNGMLDSWNRLFVPEGHLKLYSSPILLWCFKCGEVKPLTNNVYTKQLSLADVRWKCPDCKYQPCPVIEV